MIIMGHLQSASIVKDRFSGEDHCFGFVEMPNKEEADKAIAGLNGKDLKGRPLTVNEARPGPIVPARAEAAAAGAASAAAAAGTERNRGHVPRVRVP